LKKSFQQKENFSNRLEFKVGAIANPPVMMALVQKDNSQEYSMTKYVKNTIISVFL